MVVNAGSPVEMPWLDSVAAVLLTWFPGQEAGGRRWRTCCSATPSRAGGCRRPGPPGWPTRRW
ncbi:hypothetical protein ACFSTC_36535 [Nonomuraea ferruginea]